MVSTSRQSGVTHGVPSTAQTDTENHVASPAGAVRSGNGWPLTLDPHTSSVAPKSAPVHGRGVVVGMAGSGTVVPVGLVVGEPPTPTGGRLGGGGALGGSPGAGVATAPAEVLG